MNGDVHEPRTIEIDALSESESEVTPEEPDEDAPIAKYTAQWRVVVKNVVVSQATRKYDYEIRVTPVSRFKS